MKTHLFYLSLLLTLIAFSAKAQKSIEFTTTKQNTEKKNVEKLLIVGVGTTPARIFLENLAEELGKDLKRRGVQSEYQYIGSDYELANEEMIRLLKDPKYKTILLINQSDTTVSDRRGGSNGYVSLPTGSATPAIPLLYSPLLKKKAKYFFEQEFAFRLFQNDQSVSFWDASLNLYADLSKKSLYADVSEKIIKSFQDNRVFW